MFFKKLLHGSGFFLFLMAPFKTIVGLSIVVIGRFFGLFMREVSTGEVSDSTYDLSGNSRISSSVMFFLDKR